MKARTLCLGALTLLSSVVGCSGGGAGGAPPDVGSWNPGAGGSGTGAGGAAGASSSSSASSSSTSGASSSGAQSSSSSSSGGSGGQGGAGAGGMNAGGAAPTMLDLHQATIFDNPTNLADWPVTTTITDVEFQYGGGDGVHVEFSKQDGPGSWPDVTPPGWDGPLEYTLGIAEYINGQWYASAAIQFWRGLAASGGNVALDQQIAKNWYYDGRWGDLAGRQPATGELIGIFVVAGNARGVHDDGSQSLVHERSNVVLVPMPDVNGAKYTF